MGDLHWNGNIRYIPGKMNASPGSQGSGAPQKRKRPSSCIQSEHTLSVQRDPQAARARRHIRQYEAAILPKGYPRHLVNMRLLDYPKYDLRCGFYGHI
jgi:hypothetical protein